MSERQLYRLRAPSTGRELLLRRRAGQGLHATRTRARRSRSWGRCSRCTRRSLACHGPSRRCASATGATSRLRRISTTAPRAAAGWPRCPAERRAHAPRSRGSPYRSSCSSAVAGCGGAQRRRQRNVPGGPVDLEGPGQRRRAQRRATPTPTAEADAHRRRPRRHAHGRRPAAARPRPTPPTPARRPTEHRRRRRGPADDDHGTGTQAPGGLGTPGSSSRTTAPQNPGAC